MKSQKHTRAVFAAVLASSVWSTAIAQEVGTLNTFVNGNKTDAGEVNANFDALKSAVNDNNSQIGKLKTDVANIPAGPQGRDGLPGDTGPAYFASFDFEQTVGSSSDLIDSSGNGNNLTQTSARSVIYAAGHVGNGLELVGNESVVNANADVNLRESLTVSAWVQPIQTGSTTPQTIVSLEGVFAFGLIGNGVKLILDTQNATSQQNLWQGAGTVVFGAWNHVMASYDGVAIRTFVNGQLTGFVPFAKGYLKQPANKTLRVGARSATTDFFLGVIDELRISPIAVQGDPFIRIKWTALPLKSTVSATGGVYQDPQYRRVDDVVCLRGMVKGANAAGSIIATLPVDFRPPKQVVFPTAGTAAGRSGRVDVTAAGDVLVQIDNLDGYIELDTICFSTSIN